MKFPLPETIVKPNAITEEHLKFAECSKRALEKSNKNLAFGWTPSNTVTVGEVYKQGKYKSWQNFYTTLYECLHLGLITNLKKNQIYPKNFLLFSFEIGEEHEHI